MAPKRKSAAQDAPPAKDVEMRDDDESSSDDVGTKLLRPNTDEVVFNSNTDVSRRTKTC